MRLVDLLDEGLKRSAAKLREKEREKVSGSSILGSDNLCILQGASGYVRNFMRDFCHFYAQFLFFNRSKYIKCENCAFSMENMRVLLI